MFSTVSEQDQGVEEPDFRPGKGDRRAEGSHPPAGRNNRGDETKAHRNGAALCLIVIETIHLQIDFNVFSTSPATRLVWLLGF